MHDLEEAMANGKVKIDGYSIAYARRGRGQPLMLIHGYPLDHRIWEDVAKELEGDYDLVLPDLFGFGDSKAVGADHSMIDYASDLRDLMDHLRMSAAIVVGHSMGGYIALAFAREFPQRLSGLGLVASQTFSDTPETREARYETAARVLKTGVLPVAEAMAPRLCEPAGIQVVLRDLILAQPPAGVSSALRAMAGRPDSTEVLKDIKLPVAIVHGQADALIPIERARKMRVTQPSAHYVELPGIGHMPMMEDPKGTSQALRYFVGGDPNGRELSPR
jgi:pimeloyl-ACP methyl ester carboxylesterase